MIPSSLRHPANLQMPFLNNLAMEILCKIFNFITDSVDDGVIDPTVRAQSGGVQVVGGIQVSYVSPGPLKVPSDAISQNAQNWLIFIWLVLPNFYPDIGSSLRKSKFLSGSGLGL